jgi:ABC-2 type transport system permease protein
VNTLVDLGAQARNLTLGDAGHPHRFDELVDRSGRDALHVRLLVGINLAIATASFWFVRIDTLRWVVMSLEQEFSRYPISIYQRGVRIILAFVLPFAFMNYFPATFLLHKSEDGLHLSPTIGLFTPLVGVLVLALAYAFWRIGINRYQGTGS